MNVIRGPLNKNNRRQRQLGGRNINIPPSFQRLRSRTSAGLSGFNMVHSQSRVLSDRAENCHFGTHVSSDSDNVGVNNQFFLQTEMMPVRGSATGGSVSFTSNVIGESHRNVQQLRLNEFASTNSTYLRGNNSWRSNEQTDLTDNVYVDNERKRRRKNNDNLLSEFFTNRDTVRGQTSSESRPRFSNINDRTVDEVDSQPDILIERNCFSPVENNEGINFLPDDAFSKIDTNSSNYYNSDKNKDVFLRPVMKSKRTFLSAQSSSRHESVDNDNVEQSLETFTQNNTFISPVTINKHKSVSRKRTSDNNFYGAVSSNKSNASTFNPGRVIPNEYNNYENLFSLMKENKSKSKTIEKLKDKLRENVGHYSRIENHSITNSVQNPVEPATLMSKILETPDGNHHLILPLLTSSSDRTRIPRTPIASGPISSLLPLSSFVESERQTNRSGFGSGNQPHTTPSVSDKLRTPHSISGGSYESGHHTILAITEGRGLARGEVGIAVIDVKRPQIVLCQMSDNQTYTNTLTKINFFNPVEILVPNTFAETPQAVPLFGLLSDYFPNTNMTTVLRRHFNDKDGLLAIQNLCLPEYSSVELILRHKFYALSAVAALIKYIEFSQTVLFSRRSLKVEYQGAENIMTIDMESAKQLELVLCNSGGGYEKSLLGILNHCSTVGGRRYLRANILQPPFNQQVTDTRLECVTELVQDPTLLTSLKSEIVKFEDVEQLLWLSMQLPNLNMIDKPSELQMNFILLLKTTLIAIPCLVECLADGKATYFSDALEVLKDNRYDLILEIIRSSINDDAKVVKGFMASQHQRCFAIKPGVNGLLDVARSTYSNLIEATHNKVDELGTEHNLPLKLSSSNSKGMHIQISLIQNRSFKITDLPAVFIQATRVSKNLITCTTEEILILNQRMKHALREIQLMSNAIVGEILCKVREHIGCLYKLCEVIAEIDILLSFALVSSSIDFVRPEFGDELKLVSSRHPILDVINSSRPIGNDVTASPEINFHIITGPNMGGKSIYIRQIALLQIMAQIGCYVPAKSAKLCLIRSLFSRIGFDDSIEHNASTFKLEMLQMKYILQSANNGHRSLIIVDELCRGTCSEEGTAIAWALCEELAELNAFTFFTTHFHYLTQLEDIHSNIKNWHFEVEQNENGRLTFTHRILEGVTTVFNYGIELAKQTALPDSVMELITETRDELVSKKQALTREAKEIESDDTNNLTLAITNMIRNNSSVEEICKKIKQVLTNDVETRNVAQSIIDTENYDVRSGSRSADNDSIGGSHNTADLLCNVEVQLEEMSGNINCSSSYRCEKITTQECVNMLEDNIDESTPLEVNLLNETDDTNDLSDQEIPVICIDQSDDENGDIDENAVSDNQDVKNDDVNITEVE